MRNVAIMASIWICYRKTIACLPPGEQIYIFFEKIRFASQKLNFINFLAKNQ